MEETDSEGLQTKVVENQPYDESLEINDSEEVASIYTPTPRHQALPRSARLPSSAMADNSSDEFEEEINKVPREGVPQPPGHRGKDTDPIPPTPSRGPQRVGWYLGSQKLRKEKKVVTQRGFSEDDDEEEDSSETDSDSDDDDEHGAPLEGAYDPADYEHLPVSTEMKELFQYITRYTPQLVDLDHKLKPFIPDFIPAVGDIDAFLKVPRPDGKPDNLGLLVLDEPSTKQSDPTVLSLWLTENSKQHTTTQQVKVKSLEDPEKNPKAIDMWIESISELHRFKPPATVHYTRPMPDIDTLMQEWCPEFEELLGKVSLPTAEMDCSLAEYVDMICAILDIPVYKSRIQSLHLLFSLYSEFKNSQHFKALAEGKKAPSPPSTTPSQAGEEMSSFT
ncbi:intraflagellar transport protein 46 homolog isoform X1 [Ornithorhynchus anatinus]|uniref:intraflagellar transport protein 46 homolog isoform X1 n=2 Tax=Ornithorhynchus anatinus TaxID=9258 RepID=UPI0010A7DA0D|nr:intraflagellar transport protein 46 homolog isoform X1 [Ornithorhynchus anatinus]